jgi:hypothetical protein
MREAGQHREGENTAMKSRTILAALLVVLCGMCTLPAIAQDSPPKRPSATVTIHQVQVAFIGSGTAGGGTLSYRGRAYPFKLGGLGIGGFGVSRLEATGTVYNLNSLQDINGVYVQARYGWAAADQGRGKMWLQNPNGVYLKLQARRRGLALSLGADGMVLQLGS